MELSFLKYALSFLKRDTFVTILHSLLYSILFYFFIFSNLIQNIILKTPEKNSSILLNISVDLSFMLCIVTIIFSTTIKILLKRNEIGVMMAVGGNRPGVVFLVTLETLIGIIPGFFLAFILVFFFLPMDMPQAPQIPELLHSSLVVLLYSGLTILSTIVPGTYFATLVDPYKFIKRLK